MSVLSRLLAILAATMMLSSCVATDVGPVNVLVARAGPPSPDFVPDRGGDGRIVVGLSFSGGGTRAAAFAHGVLLGLDEVAAGPGPRRRTLVDEVRMVSGASGGAVAAAYLGLRGAVGYRDFRERFLVRDAESYLRTSTLSPVNVARLVNGGVNDRSSFARWLDENLFDGATYRDLQRPDAPAVWINASDIYNGTPFLFEYDTFAALCSDLDRVRLADAVAASAAVPIVFAPVVLDARKPDCGYERPAWLVRALADPEASLRLKAYSRALDSYQDADPLDFVKLLDGGLTDNLGVTGFVVNRLAAETPHAPLSAAAAARLQTLLFVVADAGHVEPVEWARHVHGPGIGGLIDAVTNTGIGSAVRSEYDALKLAMGEWRAELVRWRCALPSATVKRLRGTLAGWNCRDVTFVVEHLSFADLDPATQVKLNAVPTRLKLPTEQVDLTIEAGRAALRGNAAIRAAVRARGATVVAGGG